MDWWRRRKVDFTTLPDDLAVPQASESEVDTTVVEAVGEALARLNESHRQIIELHDLGEPRSYREIADLLTTAEYQVTESAARVRHHRAQNALRAILEADPRIQERLKRRNVLVEERT